MWWVIALLIWKEAMAQDFGCSKHEYYNTKTEKCTECSLCPEDLIIQPCQGTTDTICNWLSEIDFSFLKHLPSDGRNVVKVESTPSVKVEQTPSVLTVDEDEQWKTVSLAVIGINIVLILTGTVLFIVYRYRYRVLCKFSTEVHYRAAPAVENDYVVIHRFIPPGAPSPEPPPPPPTPSPPEPDHVLVKYRNSNRHNRYNGYKPKRRMLTEYVDDVFESDDSGGSRTINLPTIPERPGETESDSPNDVLDV